MTRPALTITATAAIVTVAALALAAGFMVAAVVDAVGSGR